MRGNAVEKSISTIHKGRPLPTPFNIITNECCEGRLCLGLVINDNECANVSVMFYRIDTVSVCLLA